MISKIRDNVGRILRSSYAGHSFWMFGGQGGQALVAFLSNLILVRYLFPEDFGRFALIQANVLLAVATLSLRINIILLQETKQELESGAQEKYFGALIGQTVLVSLASLLLLWLFDLLNFWAMVLLINVLADPWIQAQRVLFERNFQYKTLSIVETGSQFLSHFFSIFGVMGGLGPAVLYLRGWIQMLGLLGGLAYVGGLQKYRVRWLTVHDWWFVLHRIRGYWLEGWLSQMFERLVIISLGVLEGQQMTGYFFQARRLAVTPSQLFDSISNRILFNFLSHKVSDREGVGVLHIILSVQIPLLLLVGVIAVFGAGAMIPWIFGPGWEPVIPIFQGMVGVLIGMTPFHMLGIYFKAQNQMWPFIVFGQGFQYCALGMALLVVVLFAYPAVYGLAWGMSIGYVGGFLLLAIPLKPLLKRKGVEQAKSVKE